MFEPEIINMIVENFGISIYMVVFSTLFSYLLGLPLGIILVVTAPGGLRPMPVFNQVLGVIVNLLRSIPFLISSPLWSGPLTARQGTSTM